MTTITPEKLAELEGLAYMATKGPWRLGSEQPNMQRGGRLGCASEVVAPEAPTEGRTEVEHYGAPLIAESISSSFDARLIVAAREAVPALVTEIRRFAVVAERVRAFVVAARRHRESEPTEAVDTHFFDQWVSNLASVAEFDPPRPLPCTTCGVDGHSAECPVDDYEARLRELTSALAGVLSTDIDKPDFEENWVAAEEVCEREQAALGLRDPSTIATPIDAPARTADGRWTLRAVVEQAVVLYEELRREAETEGDDQGENFWEGHRNTAMHALGDLQAGAAVADAALASAMRSGGVDG